MQSGRGDFDDLINAELRELLPGQYSEQDPRPVIETPPSGEPFVSSRSDDLVGLALSGGGIRSATFNLGLLQGLHYMNVLREVDYLSTVSGGGYIGGFWSAWLVRGDPYGDPPDRLFPASDRDQFGGDAAGHQVSDTPEIRHLREFSRFLSPRLGFFETEMWHAVLAFVAGLVPALLATLAFIACALIAWARIGAWFASSAGTAVAGTVALVTVLLVVLERASDRSAFPGTRVAGRWWYATFSVAALVAVGWTRLQLETWFAIDRSSVPPWPDAWLGPAGSTAIVIYPPLMTVALASFVASASALPIWLVARAIQTSATPGGGVATGAIAAVGAIERVVMRLLGLAIVWALIVLLWHLGVNLARVHIRATWAGVTALASGGIFGLLRNWLNLGFKNTGTQGLLERLKPVLPQVLAYLTIGCAMVWLISLMADYLGRSGAAWDWAAVVMLSGLLVYAFLDPAAYSLHAFYRDRIARAYLGATSPRGSQRGGANRSSEARPADDMPLDRTVARPLHLVCCTANDLSGDQVETLTRGARSAALSRFGIAIGNRFAGPPEITFASALTASAAAFNPVMGSRSTQFGPAVTFVLAALNLRLGCWVRHPATPTRGRPILPGLRFFKELLGMTNAGVTAAGVPYAADVHLSDGGHFENLGLYELVRRHCRYIIVSDCGADPTVAFDDLGNAVRRIREDFGVEIELDLAPLQLARPVTERQHAVVGTIHYDRHFDKGVLVYFKPTLNGNEPPDVGQYHTRNSEFPHEATSDQFYDEAQWESYRRLGFHSIQECFRFVERRGGSLRRDQIFTGARLEWYPTPEGLPARSLALTDRFAILQRELAAVGPYELLAQLFPEVPPPGPAGGVPVQPGSVEATRVQLATMTALLQAMQVMEDVWQACDLDTEWKHPLNVGWVNAFARWATANAFVEWWPILAPNFHPGFQRFIREQFYPRAQLRRPMGFVDVRPRQNEVLPVDDLPEGLAARWWLERMRLQPKRQGRPVYEYRLPASGSRPELQVALIMVSDDPIDPTLVSWTSEDLFVPPSLWGSGIGSEFLPAILDTLDSQGVKYCDVHVVSRPDEKDVAHRQERIAFTEFYRSQGFRTLSQRPTMPKLVQELNDVDTWVTLRCRLPRVR